MSDREPSLQEFVSASFQYHLNNVFTSIPCIVVAVRSNLETQLVDIQPTINQKMKDGTTSERPVILGVPVSFQVSNKSGFTFPINVGDTGLAVFSMRNMDAWKNGNGRPSTPLNFGKYDKGDAIFIPGIQPPSVAVNNPAKRVWPHSTNDTVVVHNIGEPTETEVRLLASGGVVINTNQDVVANCANASINAQQAISLSSSSLNITAGVASISIGNTTWAGNIEHTGNYTMSGTATFNGIVFNTHVHGTSPSPSNP